VVLPDAFRPGDVVRARVLSLGDARSFFLTTAQEALGVVAAKGPAGGWEQVEEGGGFDTVGFVEDTGRLFRLLLAALLGLHRTHDLFHYACRHRC
jgi:hypothetical protein